jgi:hypothetical protein
MENNRKDIAIVRFLVNILNQQLLLMNFGKSEKAKNWFIFMPDEGVLKPWE